MAANQIMILKKVRKITFDTQAINNCAIDLTASNEDEEESKTEETTTCDTPGTPELLPKIDFKASK